MLNVCIKIFITIYSHALIKLVNCDPENGKDPKPFQSANLNTNDQQSSQSDSQSPEMIGIICAILSFCFLCIFALVCILCIYHRRKIANEDNKKTKIKKDIDTLMKLTFTKFSEIQNVFNTRECAICLEVFQSDSEVTQFKICHHIFHKECMLSFYSMNLVDTVKSKCPLCKADINSENNFI